MARRIVTYAEVGEECYIDEHMGFIKFGSRVDVYLPIGTEVCVSMGQLTTGNQRLSPNLNNSVTMTKVIKNSIPNTVTCLNLFSGCIACVMAFEARYDLALLFIVLSAVFDFFDGMLARILNAHSIIGKDLDSLADDVSFGVAPSLIVFSLFKEMYYPANMEFLAPYLPYAAFLISVFSALRLAKFNNDTRQTSSFVGLPVPANALFWGSFVVGAHDFLVSENCHPVYLLITCLSVFRTTGIRNTDVSLKFKNLSWNDNKISFIFLIICIPLLLSLGISSFAAIIVWYILLSLFTRKS